MFDVVGWGGAIAGVVEVWIFEAIAYNCY